MSGPLVVHLLLPGWACRAQLLAHLGFREVGFKPGSSVSDGAPHLYSS